MFTCLLPTGMMVQAQCSVGSTFNDLKEVIWKEAARLPFYAELKVVLYSCGGGRCLGGGRGDTCLFATSPPPLSLPPFPSLLLSLRLKPGSWLPSLAMSSSFARTQTGTASSMSTTVASSLNLRMSSLFPTSRPTATSSRCLLHAFIFFSLVCFHMPFTVTAAGAVAHLPVLLHATTLSHTLTHSLTHARTHARTHTRTHARNSLWSAREARRSKSSMCAWATSSQSISATSMACEILKSQPSAETS